ncbi:pyridoxal phosphate-dependent transferase [Melampsora americana]|nr:pyridoxal phosphate-dependent transferase [Melampsora americana]
MTSNSISNQKATWARRLSASACLSLTDPQFARYMDNVASPSSLRSEFRLPKKSAISSATNSITDQTSSTTTTTSIDDEENDACVYLCGNSLGLQPRRAAEMVLEEMDVWAERAVNGHFDHPLGRNWADFSDLCLPTLATLVGASSTSEVAVNGSLTTNLHILMITFYRPTKERFKILLEARAFPSDMYAFASQVEMHGFNPSEALILLSPREGEYHLRTEDILSTINKEGPNIALVLLPGVQYYTGQAFPIAQITSAAHQQGSIVGWDLAHAIGNIPLELHSSQVDFAVWCSYKYLNAGPGAIAGFFVHEKWTSKPDALDGRPRLAGWFGHNPETRFKMPEKFEPIKGAGQFIHSNPSIFSLITLYSSLQLFSIYPGGLKSLRTRSEELTSYLEIGLKGLNTFQESPSSIATEPRFSIITPQETKARGAQLSLIFLPVGKGLMNEVFRKLSEKGVITDEREPDVLRFSPVAMYNTFEDCRKSIEALNEVMNELS